MRTWPGASDGMAYYLTVRRLKIICDTPKEVIALVMKAWVREVIDYSRETGLDMSAKRQVVALAGMQPVEGVDAGIVEKIRRRIADSRFWPKDLPLVVLASSVGEGYEHEGYTILDGHHRVAAAEALGYRKIPAIVVSFRSWEEITARFDVPRIDYIQEVLAITSPVVAKNMAKGVGGKPKRRGLWFGA